MNAIQTELFGPTADPREFACKRPKCEEPTTGLKLPASRLDPLSSRLAAHEMEHSGKRRRQIEAVVDVVRNHPEHTSNELSYLCPSIDRYTFGRRLPEAEKLGLIERHCKEDGNPLLRKCTVSGKLAMTWRIKE